MATINKVFDDVRAFCAKMQHDAAVAEMGEDKKKRFIELRLKMLQEEMGEIMDAVEDNDQEEFVDGLIDLIYFAAGTLTLFQCDPEAAWDNVHNANMQKEKGIKAGRPNPLGLPDALKPEGWAPPAPPSTGMLPSFEGIEIGEMARHVRVLKAVAIATDTTVEEIIGSRRFRKFTDARRIAAFLLREAGITLEEIGNILGGRDHSSISYLTDSHHAVYSFDRTYTEMTKRAKKLINSKHTTA